MKRQNKPKAHKSLVRDMGTLTLMLLANRMANAIEKWKCARDSEDVIRRKLTIVSLIYHAIGIIYNE